MEFVAESPGLRIRSDPETLFTGSGSYPGYVKLYKQEQNLYKIYLVFFTFSGGFFHFVGKKSYITKSEGI